MKTQKLFHKDFTLVVIGQIISLFGNTILRFALPLHLYNQTGSATLLGLVSAVSFIPMILLSPVGGIIADRVNKRNIMVSLDFATAALMLAFLLLYRQASLVPLMVLTLMLLYAIQGAYQPAVQASMPVLLSPERLVQGNAVINAVSQLTNLIGPVLGGVLFAFAGLGPIVAISVACFFLSAVMEISIHIPFEKKTTTQTAGAIVKQDLTESFTFIRREQPIVGRAILIVAAFNLFFSAMLVVGTPVLVSTLFNDQTVSNQLYGYAQGAFAAGGLGGGLLAGIIGPRVPLGRGGHWLLLGTALCICPIGFAFLFGLGGMPTYLILTVCGFLSMAFASLFSILALSFVQQATPEAMLGKVISVVMAISMCAQPAGQAMYGKLFDVFSSAPYIVLFLSGAASLLIALFSKATFKGLLTQPALKAGAPA